MPSKQVKRRKCLPRAVSEPNVCLRYRSPIDNAGQTNLQLVQQIGEIIVEFMVKAPYLAQW